MPPFFPHPFLNRSNIEPFVKAIKSEESPTTDAAENKHEFFELYQKYLSVFERRIEDHIARRGGNVEAFVDQARTLLDRSDPTDPNVSSRRTLSLESS